MNRYKKQIIIPDIGSKGQKILLSSKVLVLGCGGLGSAVIPLLAACGIGHLILCDDDIVQLSNLNRQTIFQECDIGCNKAQKARDFVISLNSQISVEAYDTRIGPDNFESYFKDIDLVVDCVDRLAVKLFIHDACIIKKKPLIHSSAIGFYGQILTIPIGGKPCLRCFFEQKLMKTALNCANAGIIAPTVSLVGSIVAMEVIKYLLNLSQNLIGSLQRVDLKNNYFNNYKFQYNPKCIACGVNPSIDPYDRNCYESKMWF